MADAKGPQFTDFGLRRATNDLTPDEAKAEHKWRMKNDIEYKHEQAVKKVEAAKTKGTQTDHFVTDNSNHTQIIGGMMIKTPVATKTDSTTKTPVKPNISLKNK